MKEMYYAQAGALGSVVVRPTVSCARCGVGSAHQQRAGRAFLTSGSRLGATGLRVVTKRPAFVPNRPRFTTNGVCFTTNGRPFATKGRPVALNHGRVVTNARLPATNGRSFAINAGRLFAKRDVGRPVVGLGLFQKNPTTGRVYTNPLYRLKPRCDTKVSM